MSNEKKRELFSYKVLAGSRTYFFDVKETKDSAKYLVISESRKVGEKYEHNRVMIFQENLNAFAEGLQKTMEFLQQKDS